MISHKKHIFSNVPNWENFIDILNYKYKIESKNNNELLLKNNLNQTTDILIQGRMYMHVWELKNDKTFDILKNTDYPNILKYINEDFEVKASINLAANNDKFIKHHDSQDVLTWQCVGSVNYIIEEDGLQKTYKLEPGDLFFMPAGTIHQAVAIEPRASLIFDFNN